MPMNVQNVDEVLKAAVVMSWSELIHGVQSGLVHVEYKFSATGSLDSFQVWTSVRRGYWLLACSYRASPSEGKSGEVQFDNGYQSAGLAEVMAVVMKHPGAFTLPQNFGGQGLLQITTPTEMEIKAAAASMKDAFTSVGVPTMTN